MAVVGQGLGSSVTCLHAVSACPLLPVLAGFHFSGKAMHPGVADGAMTDTTDYRNGFCTLGNAFWGPPGNNTATTTVCMSCY